MKRGGGTRWGFLALLSLICIGCADTYPEVVVVNQTEQRILLRNISYNGCLWDGVLAFGEATAPQRCPPGSDRVHFKKCDVSQHDDALVRTREEGEESPLWFNYQTVTKHELGYGDFQKIEIRAEDLEQDFSAPGPYGH